MLKGKRLSSETHQTMPGFLVCPSKQTPSSSTLDCEFLAAGTGSLSWLLVLWTSVNALWCVMCVCVCFLLRWLVYAHPSFQGSPRVLEVGGYSNPAAWGVDKPYVGSLHPLKIVNIAAYADSLLFFKVESWLFAVTPSPVYIFLQGEPRVENTSEPKVRNIEGMTRIWNIWSLSFEIRLLLYIKMVIYDKPYFTGKSRTITSNMRDFMTRTDCQQTAFMYSVGSLKVLGGMWVLP